MEDFDSMSMLNSFVYEHFLLEVKANQEHAKVPSRKRSTQANDLFVNVVEFVLESRFHNDNRMSSRFTLRRLFDRCRWLKKNRNEQNLNSIRTSVFSSAVSDDEEEKKSINQRNTRKEKKKRQFVKQHACEQKTRHYLRFLFMSNGPSKSLFTFL